MMSEVPPEILERENSELRNAIYNHLQVIEVLRYQLCQAKISIDDQNKHLEDIACCSRCYRHQLSCICELRPKHPWSIPEPICEYDLGYYGKI